LSLYNAAVLIGRITDLDVVRLFVRAVGLHCRLPLLTPKQQNNNERRKIKLSVNVFSDGITGVPVFSSEGSFRVVGSMS